ncbi:hypothetical protein C8J56DRAFT_1077898 [Mycena floridula]|nr:hypothetical protein C8J56DRAFT_1077898 [Mycena floridula]
MDPTIDIGLWQTNTTYEELTVSDKELLKGAKHGCLNSFINLYNRMGADKFNLDKRITHAEVADALFLNLGSKGVPSLQQTDSSAVSKAQMAIHCLLNHLRGEGINVDALVPVLQCSFGGVITWLDFFLSKHKTMQSYVHFFGASRLSNPHSSGRSPHDRIALFHRQFRFTLWRLMNLMTPNNEPVAKKASRGAQGLIDATDLGSKKFAKLIIQKLRSLTPTQTPDIILFLHNFIILLKVPTKDHPFITVCFEEGIIQLIVENLVQMAKQTTSMLNRDSREHESIITSFQFISAHIATGVVVSWIIQAIKSGILSVDLTGFPECGADFLRATLPKYLAHRPVVKAAMEALATMRADPKMSVMLARIARESSSAADAWGIFEDLVAHRSVQLPMVFVEPAVCGNIQVSCPLLRLIGYQEFLTKHSERHCGMDRDDMRARPHKYTITTGLFEIAEGQVRSFISDFFLSLSTCAYRSSSRLFYFQSTQHTGSTRPLSSRLTRVFILRGNLSSMESFVRFGIYHE